MNQPQSTPINPCFCSLTELTPNQPMMNAHPIFARHPGRRRGGALRAAALAEPAEDVQVPQLLEAGLRT